MTNKTLAICLQDAPSFLQEVTTARGQVTYSKPELKTQFKIPDDIDPNDDVAMVRQCLILPLDAMAARSPSITASETECSRHHSRCDNALIIGGMRLHLFAKAYS
jgi:hypothetical protein